MKYTLEQRVKGGIIVRIESPFFYFRGYIKRNCKTQEDIDNYYLLLQKIWGEDFGKYPLYVIELDKPQKRCTLEQYLDQNPFIAKCVKEECLQEFYDKSVPEDTELTVPEKSISLDE